MIRMFGIHQERYLMRPEGALYLQTIDEHWPARPGGVILVPCIALDLSNVLDDLFQGIGHKLMHLFRLITFHKVRCPTAAIEKLLQFLMLDTGQNSRVANFVAIEMQDRQNRSVGNRVKKLVGMPCCCQGACFRFTVADDTGNNQIRIVERSTESMTE